MGIRSSIAQRTLLLTAANLAMRVVAMVFQVYLTGQVGAAGIGLLQLILTVNGFAITLGTSGIRVAAMYLPAEEYGMRRPDGVRQAMVWCLGAGTVLSSLVGIAMAVFAEPLAVSWVKDLRAVDSLRLLGLTLPLTCLSAVLSGYFTACDKIGRLVAVEIADRAATVLLTVWLLQLGVSGDLSHACVSIVGGGALASLGSVAVLLVLLAGDLRHTDGRRQLHMGKRLVRLCVPVALNDYLRSGLGTLEQFLIPHGLTRCGGSRTAALADYGTIQGMVFPVLLFPSTVLYALSDLLVPELALCKAQKNRTRIRHITETCLRMGILFAALVAGLLYVLAEPLGLLLYDSESAGRYLQWFAPLVPVLYLDCIVDGMHKGLGQQVYCVRVNTLTNLMDVVLLFWLVPQYGIGGYFFTYVLTHAINCFLSLRRLLQISGEVRLLRTVGLTLLSVAAAVMLAGQCALLYLAAAVLLMLLTGAWTPEDTRHLRQMFGR